MAGLQGVQVRTHVYRRRGGEIDYLYPENVRLVSPAVVLCGVRQPETMAGVVRVCASFGVPDVVYTGSSFDKAVDDPRNSPYPPFHMPANAAHISIYGYDDPLALVPEGYTAVAIQTDVPAPDLATFEQPHDPVYFFGSERDPVPTRLLKECEHVVSLPGLHDHTLPVAVGMILYDRYLKRFHKVEPL